jgi:hypothetical protein
MSNETGQKCALYGTEDAAIGYTLPNGVQVGLSDKAWQKLAVTEGKAHQRLLKRLEKQAKAMGLAPTAVEGDETMPAKKTKKVKKGVKRVTATRRGGGKATGRRGGMSMRETWASLFEANEDRAKQAAKGKRVKRPLTDEEIQKEMQKEFPTHVESWELREIGGVKRARAWYNGERWGSINKKCQSYAYDNKGNKLGTTRIPGEAPDKKTKKVVKKAKKAKKVKKVRKG